MRLAYLVSRFPVLSETFVIREVLEVRALGHEVQVYSLKSRPETGYDEAAEEIVRATQYSPFLLAAPLLWANLKTAVRRPFKYWGALLYVLFHSLPQWKECLKTLAAYPKAIYYGRLMVLRGVEHIHVHFANVPTACALVIHRLWGIPYSFTCHAHDLFVFRAMLRQKVHHAEFVVAISEFNRSFLAEFCAPQDMSKVRVVHCGAETQRLARVPRAPEKGLVLSVARFSEHKGLHYLVEACALLRTRGTEVRCVLAGDGEEEDALRALVRRLDLQSVVQMPGRVPAEEVFAYVARAHVFVLPAVQACDGAMDGIPVSLMEAMAMRVPVISTRTSGIPELVEDGRTGLLVEPRDPQGLADAIARLFGDEALAERLAENAYRHVQEAFDLRTNARRVAELIERRGRTRE